ncbi:spermidine acetyltransferase [Alteribacter lacisalsi]|uniref:Spermidine acetyltransferase n=1 Tax=Alteribacter lacisalsi TaxID=2045244 RepID=A0A2W0H9F8_9BACI|nr:GNAT family N-acetyltransferase [Alteribacter lacisalsi]PYZ96710.1 spermidine acetyltransferase [Alteribacter lacisalsi]
MSSRTLHLKRIDGSNWEEAIQLKVREDQKSFVASNLYSIAQVQFLEDFEAKGIYKEDTMIGFALYGIDKDDSHYWIYRLMIDQNHQGKGSGTEALRLIINDIEHQNTEGRPCIMIGYEPDNNGARHVYKKAGFAETEMASWGEQLAKYDLTH